MPLPARSAACLVLIGWLGLACSKQAGEAVSFSPEAARTLIEAFLAAPTFEGRYAYVSTETARLLAERPRPAGTPVPALVAGSLVLTELKRDQHRVLYKAALRERMGGDESPATRQLTLVQERGVPRVVWLDPLVDDAWSEYQEGRHKAARARFEAMLELDPWNGVLADRAGWCAMRLKELGEAEELFERAAALLPDKAGPLASLAALAFERQDYATAEARLRSALQRERTVEALDNLGKVLEVQGRAAEAQATWKEAIVLDPKHPAAYLYLAEFHRTRKDWAGCLEHADRAYGTWRTLERSFQDRVLESQSICRFMLGERDAARSTAQQLQDRGVNGTAYRRLEVFFNAQGQPLERMHGE
jgi:tetratricopeptide (TPR) repeat protein